jgi:hypothetical protein
MAEDNDNLFQEFSLDDDMSILNSVEESGTQSTQEQPDITQEGGNGLDSELQDFSLDFEKEEIPIKKSDNLETQESGTTTADTTAENETTEAASTENTDTTPTEESPANEEDSSLYTPLASALHEQGVLPNFDVDKFQEEGGDFEALAKAMEKEIDEGVNSFVESLPEQFKEQLLAYHQGVDLATYQKLQKDSLEYENITADKLSEDVSLQKKVVKEDLLSKGFSEAKATKYIENLESLNELGDEAVEALELGKSRRAEAKAKAVEEAKQRQQLAEEQRQQTVKQISETLENTKEIVPGKSLNKISRDKVFKSMTTIVGNDQNGNPMNAVMQTRSKDPLKFETTLHYLHSLGVFDGNWNDIIKTAKTKAVTELDRKLQDARNLTGRAPSLSNKNEGSILDSF